MTRDCSCTKCVAACKRSSGLFAPGEAENAAKFLGIPFDEFKKNLIQTYWQDLESDPLVWQPRKVGDSKFGEIASDEWTNTVGQCVFLKDDKCSIHEVKPYECRQSLLCEKSKNYWPEINELWKREKED